MKIASISIADYCEATDGMLHDVERLYFRMILKMLAREGGLPDDDAENARIFGYDRRVFARLKAKLLAWPNAIYVEDGLLKNKRVEDDIESVRARRADAVENGRKGGLAKAELSRKSEGSPPEVSQKSDESPPEVRQKSRRIADTTINENNEMALASPSPTPSPERDSTSVAIDAAREGAALLSTDDLSKKLIEACNGSLDNPVNCMGLLSLSIPQMWINQGCDLELDVLPTLRAAGQKHHGKNIRSWSYFTPMISEAAAKRKAGLPATAGDARQPQPKAQQRAFRPIAFTAPTAEELEAIRA